VPEFNQFIDPVFAKISPKRSFSVIENEPFGLVFAKTGSINSDIGQYWCFLVSSDLLMLLKVTVQSLVKYAVGRWSNICVELSFL
jgi:hypothetical protein